MEFISPEKIFDQPERSKREDFDCCKRVRDLEDLSFQLCFERLTLHEDLVNELIAESKMRCSEHCGNTVRDK